MSSMKTHCTNGRPTKSYLRLLAHDQAQRHFLDELAAWLERPRDARPLRNAEEARACLLTIRELDGIFHKHGLCQRDPKECLSCQAMLEEA